MTADRTKKTHEIPTSAGAVLITMGVVYGDIGTSPMYVMKSIVAGNGGLGGVSDELILGALSLVIWTITLLTTMKYVVVAMQADNHGEGGIFSLYSLVKHFGKWLIFPAMIGGAALLADGVMTPAVTVTTAIEGLRSISSMRELLGDGQNKIIFITITIIALLFLVQRAGTSSIGRAFGPVMAVWFLFLAAAGLGNIGGNVAVLKAFNPVYAVKILTSPANDAGIMILGSVFLATTGAEALYSDMGHVGKNNIFLSWPFVKICLIINYLGQGAWLMACKSNGALASIPDMNPFFQMLPEGIRPFAVFLGAAAAIIASQALISGSFTLVSEASRLDLMPHMQITYPSQRKGQIYIPLVNQVLWFACTGVVLLFQTSAHMEAAYGLAITLTMLMTTVLLFLYLRKVKKLAVVPFLFLFFFGGLEGSFFISSLSKFSHGGYVALFMALILFGIMVVWHEGTGIESSQAVLLPLRKYLPQLEKLKNDSSQELLADNLVFITKDSDKNKLDRDILYSIFDKKPKRANAYWFVGITVTDEPYTREYSVYSMGTNYMFRVQLRLGFRENQRVNVYLRQIVDEMVKSGELPSQKRRYSIYEPGVVGTFKFCMIRKLLVPESDIGPFKRTAISLKYAIRHFAGTPDRWYGLENSSLIIEYVPLFIQMKPVSHLTRV